MKIATMSQHPESSRGIVTLNNIQTEKVKTPDENQGFFF